jgi:prepilin-type N-terminal cleavage/methylation domain-containing protein
MTPRAHKGFTLIEMVVVIGILAVVGVALTGMISYVYRTNAFIFEETSATDSARRGVQFALENIREATYGADGSYPLSTAATSTIAFYADVDNDGVVEKIRYYLTNGTLYRGVTNPAGAPPAYTGQTESSTVVASYVRNDASTPVFHYYDDTGAELSAPADVSKVASVSAVVGVDVDPRRAPLTYTLIGTATIRSVHSDD